MENFLSSSTVITITISITALVISITALIYTAKTYLLKQGLDIRGSFSIVSSISCEDKYVSGLVIENMKDRSTAIFKIYLLLGHNYYLEIEDFEDAPLILKPFETHSKQYDPVEFYSASTKRIDLNNLWDSRKHKIILSTSDGKYVIKKRINKWDPIPDVFKNYMTAIIQPMRLIYKNKSYGSNAKFIVEIELKDGKKETIPIYLGDYQIRKFRHFRLTKESLNSKETLEEFFHQQRIKGLLNCTDINIHDIEAWREEVYANDYKEVIRAEYQNWFVYFVIGRIYTIASNFKSKLSQRKNRKKQRKKSK